MDAIEQLKRDVREGRIGLEPVFVIMEGQQRQLETLQRELTAARQRIEELEKKLGGPAPSATAKVEQPFSTRAEEKRQQARHQHQKVKLSRKGRRGRLTTADKLNTGTSPAVSPAPEKLKGSPGAGGTCCAASAVTRQKPSARRFTATAPKP